MYPPSRVEGVVEAFVELEKALNKQMDIHGGTIVNFQNYTNDQGHASNGFSPASKATDYPICFAIGQNLEKNPSENAISGLNTKLSGYNIFLKLDQTSAPEASKAFFILHQDKVVVLRNGTVQVSE